MYDAVEGALDTGHEGFALLLDEAQVIVLMGRLTEQGVIFRVQKGLYEYTAPKFHEYLKRRSQNG